MAVTPAFSPERSPPVRSPTAAILVVSLGLLLHELCLTRVLSVVFYYHTAFLAISVAMLGLSAGALWVHLFARTAHGREAQLIGAAALGAALLPLALPWMRLDLGDLHRFLAGPALVALVIAILLALLPYIAGSAFIALMLQRHSASAGRLYAADLVGAAMGALLVVPAMEWLGGPGALLACGAIIASAALLLRQFSLLACWMPLGLLIALTVWQVAADPLKIPIDLEPGAEAPARVLAQKWNAFSRVIAVEDLGWDRGLSQKKWRAIQSRRAPQIEALIDLNAYAAMVAFDGNLSRVDYLADNVANLGYHLRPSGARVAIIGPGGGKDVLGALLFGPQAVVGIELNPILVNDFVRGRFRNFTGDIYGHPGVEIHVGEARALMQREPSRFDLIVANSVETWAAHAAGAMSLTEQTLFTVEAFNVWFDHLMPAGILSISLWDEEEHAVPMRVLTTAAAASAGRGLAPIAERVAVIGNPWEKGRWFTTVLIAKSPLSIEQRTTMRRITREQGFDCFYIPEAGADSSDASEWRKLLADPVGFAVQSPHDLTPATDDRPFFFYTQRWRDVARGWKSERPTENSALISLCVSAVAVAVLVALALFVPLWLDRRRGGVKGTALTLRELIYFGALGIAFMLVEIALIQKLTLRLGHPTYAITVVLAGLLGWSALGSRLVDRWARADRAGSKVRSVLLVLIATLAATWWLAPLAIEMGGESELLRIVIALAVLAPTGLCMGVPMPVGLGLVGGRQHRAVAWAFAITGATGVLASVAAIIGAVIAGYTAVFATGIAAYAIAFACGAPRTAPLALTEAAAWRSGR